MKVEGLTMVLSVEQLQQIMGQGIPFNQFLGIEIIGVEAEQVDLVLAQKPEYLNHVGTFHAAAQFALGEATSGTMLTASFLDIIRRRYVPLAAGANITYRRPASGNLRGTALLAKEEQEQIRHNLESNGKARFSIPVQLSNQDGRVVTEIRVDWIIKKAK